MTSQVGAEAAEEQVGPGEHVAVPRDRAVLSGAGRVLGRQGLRGEVAGGGPGGGRQGLAAPRHRPHCAG